MRGFARIHRALGAGWALARARWGYRFEDRVALEAFQQGRLRAFLDDVARTVPYYRDFAGRPIGAFPIVDKPAVLARFADFNRFGIDLESAYAHGLVAERSREFRGTLPGGVTVGLSSGTSGRRGVFLATGRERERWAAVVVGRALSPRAFARVVNPARSPLRVALLLRANSNLYATVNGVRIRFHFGDLLRPFDDLLDWLGGIAPHVVVAPPSVLGELARAQSNGRPPVRPIQAISVAEVLEDDDRDAVAHAWGIRTDEIYQCTEGFLGVTCAYGSLHLNEEFVHVEPEWLDEARVRFRPIVTDFSRTTQAFVRYRLDDVLRDDPSPCGCGRVTRRLARIEGRDDDVLWLPGRSEGSARSLRAIFPDVVRRAFMVAARGEGDWRLAQEGMEWTVALEAGRGDPSLPESVRQALLSLADVAGCERPRVRFEPFASEPPDRKRRRVRCDSKPACEGAIS